MPMPVARRSEALTRRFACNTCCCKISHNFTAPIPTMSRGSGEHMRPARPSPVAIELRRLRVGRGLTLDSAGRAAGWDKSKLSRLETGRAPVTAEHVDALASALRLTPVERMRLDRLLGDARENRADEWWSEYQHVLSLQYEELIYMESRALGVRIASTLVPGLLQAEGYARATITQSAFVPDPDDAEMLLNVRLKRRRVITDGSVDLSVTLSEAALWQSFCGRVALQQQLRHLLEVSDLRNVSLRIVRFDAPARPFFGSITLLTFAPPVPALVYAEYESGARVLKDDRTVRRYERDLEYNQRAAATENESREMIMERLDRL